MNCSSPYILNHAPFIGMAVPCRNCIPCRIARSSEWSLRITNEYLTWESGVFITLTYSDQFLPKNASLNESHLTKFIKRLRYYLSKQKRKIKYYACGEYGEKRHRPHYHLIVLGLSMDEHKLRPCPRGGYYVEAGILKDTWSYGLIHVGSVTADSISYCTHYIDKKYVGQMADEKYLQTGRIPPFQRVSQYFGRDYALKHAENIKANLFIVNRGKKIPVPKYYRKVLDIEKDPRFKEFAQDSITELYTEHLQRNNITMDSTEYVRINKIMNHSGATRDIRQFAFQKLSHEEIVEIYDIFNTINTSRHNSRMQNTTNLKAKYEIGRELHQDDF